MGMRLERHHKRLVVIITLLAALIVFLLAYGAATAGGATTLTAEPGTPLVIELEGNPYAGYAWDCPIEVE